MAGEIQLNSTTFATESGGTITVSNVDSAANRQNLGLQIGVDVQQYDADTTKNDVANTFTANQIISVTDNTNAALRVTQLGTGNALVVEDSTNPDSTPFVVDASGNVGIGTSPTAKLEVVGTIKSDSNFRSQKSSLADGLFGFSAVTDSPYRYSGLSLRNHSGITNPATELTVTAEDGTIQRFWVDNSGNFRISTDLTHIGTTSGTVIGTQTSDERIKNIEGVAPYGLAEILQLEPIKYALKTEPDTPRLGFTAQQVQDIIPESVFDTGEDMGEGEPTKLGMEYVQIIPVLVNAMKEQQTIIESQQSQIDSLTARIETLETT